MKVVDESLQLSKSQKKRKARMKKEENSFQSLGKPIEHATDNYNPFAELFKQQCNLIMEDTLISATQVLIEKQLGFVKLGYNEIISIIETINCNERNDW